MVTIKLPHGEWTYDNSKPLGVGGGFGEVFEGTDHLGRLLAVKRFYPDAQDAAQREIDVATALIGRSHRHVIQIYDCGRDVGSGRLFVVMPRASRSLGDLLKAGVPDRAVALETLDAVAAGIEELGDIVSRDLKPSNVLEHDGAWKIADFGLGRFTGLITTSHTMRGAMTYAYAAPELWLMKRPTKATDIYALGCIAYEMLSGRHPFPGPDEGDYRDQHLNQAPPDLRADPRIQQVVRMCLSKSADARPSAERFRKAIRRVADGGTPASPSPLARAGAAIAALQAQHQAAAAQSAEAEQTLAEIGKEAEHRFTELIGSLAERVEAEAPVARREADRIILGHGALKWGVAYRTIDVNTFAGTGWRVAFGAYIEVAQPNHLYPGRSANLWYARAPGQTDYRWWEMAYMTHPLMRVVRQITQQHPHEPLAFTGEDDLKHAAECLRKVTDTYQLAADPKMVDDEHFDDFVRRWSDWLAAAAERKLQAPSVLPE
jgi:serine/threonine-protein kinase